MDRRRFLSTLSCSIAAPLVPVSEPLSQAGPTSAPCWLDVCAPFIVEDGERGMECEIVLTSDTFSGARGHEDGADTTDYEIHLYDAAGRPVGPGGIARKLNVPAMRTTVIPIAELLGERKRFWGGMRIRLRPRGREAMHAGDLFSSAFVRWKTPTSFDNVHANPDPQQWQNAAPYFYSMPFPALGRYDCLYSLFNPYDAPSAGELVLFDPHGKRLVSRRYELKPHSSLLFDLNAAEMTAAPWTQPHAAGAPATPGHGLIAVTNDPGTAKGFAYLMIRHKSRPRFSVEHPIHQGVFKPAPAASPFDANGQFKAKNVLHSPLLFNQTRIGGLTLQTRFYLGTGLPLEEVQWVYPFAVDREGNAAWSALNDPKLPAALPDQVERGVLRLRSNQSCALDFNRLSLPRGFAGGLSLAVSPDTTHTLIKVEVLVQEWDAYAFTHCRPGLRSARSYQRPRQRGGLATDYIVSGARILKKENSLELDELIAIMNIDDRGLESAPFVELFGPRGLIARLPLGTVPPFACRHFLLSDLLTGTARFAPMTLRLVDEKTTLLMSAIHLDYTRRDIALDHGSDRFSTFLDYGCA
ncbi:MAG: hypothetical protein SF339_02735 [Blastocatellia bacterium]|nr:hypothetical protein [Blastocatellia bacterium]